MQINKNFDLTTYIHDYGIPVIFEPERPEDFMVGDKIVVNFESNVDDKIFEVRQTDFRFEMSLTPAEAASFTLDDDQGYIEIPYSIKHYRAGVCLDTIVNAKLIVWRTVPWQPNS